MITIRFAKYADNLFLIYGCAGVVPRYDFDIVKNALRDMFPSLAFEQLNIGENYRFRIKDEDERNQFLLMISPNNTLEINKNARSEI